ncbi:MAG: ChaN family lipoprotein [Hyphomicrobiaceae bacterium]
MLLAACQAAPDVPELLKPLPQQQGWLSPSGQDHELIGRLWSSLRQQFVEPEDFIKSLQSADFVLLGEKHDNRDHHRLQAWIVGALIGRGRRPALAFEQFSADQRAALDAYLARHPQSAAGIGAAVGWEKTGWPPWSDYQPIAQAALDARLPIMPANLAKSTITAIARNGVSALGAAQAASLRLTDAIPADVQTQMRREIVAAHCDMLPQDMVDPMVTVLLARDAYMAATLLEGRARKPSDMVVLIAGSGHVRQDRGVPYHLRKLRAGDQIVSVALTEARDGQSSPADYAGALGAGEMPFDYVWFTPRADDEDLCIKFADQLRRAGSQPPATE